MSNEEFAPVVALLVAIAPADWSALRAVYRYHDGNADTKTYAITASSKDWVRISQTGFEMMDFFDAYRKQKHPRMETPWTTVTVVITRENPVPDVQFAYEVPQILRRDLD